MARGGDARGAGSSSAGSTTIVDARAGAAVTACRWTAWTLRRRGRHVHGPPPKLQSRLSWRRVPEREWDFSVSANRSSHTHPSRCGITMIRVVLAVCEAQLCYRHAQPRVRVLARLTMSARDQGLARDGDGYGVRSIPPDLGKAFFQATFSKAVRGLWRGVEAGRARDGLGEGRRESTAEWVYLQTAAPGPR